MRGKKFEAVVQRELVKFAKGQLDWQSLSPGVLGVFQTRGLICGGVPTDKALVVANVNDD